MLTYAVLRPEPKKIVRYAHVRLIYVDQRFDNVGHGTPDYEKGVLI